MNRIILIGNGFDLAHGLETSYTHFIDWYGRKKSILTAENLGWDCSYEDDEIVFSNQPTLKEDFKKRFSHSRPGNIKYYDGITYKNEFLGRIIGKLELQNWVDIENEYCKMVLEHSNAENRRKDIKKLNKEFEHIKQELKNYLQNDPRVNKEIAINKEIKDKIWTGVNTKEINDVLFLTFNYTRTTDLYRDGGKLIHIHGELNNTANPMIFGFGYEKETFGKIKNLEDDYIENMKQATYTEKNNYKEVRSFLIERDYEVFIMGHSCGSSDEMLLKELFENDNCKKIKIFYHEKEKGKDNFKDIRNNILKIFSDTEKSVGDFLHKLAHKDECEPLPQNK